MNKNTVRPGCRVVDRWYVVLLVDGHTRPSHRPGTDFDCPTCRTRCYCPDRIQLSDGSYVRDGLCVAHTLYLEDCFMPWVEARFGPLGGAA